jgi:hypothetical protein
MLYGLVVLDRNQLDSFDKLSAKLLRPAKSTSQLHITYIQAKTRLPNLLNMCPLDTKRIRDYLVLNTFLEDKLGMPVHQLIFGSHHCIAKSNYS